VLAAETFMLSTISDVAGVPDEPARFRVILGETRTLELRSEAGGSNAADDARAWVQAINMQRRLVSTAKADAQRSLRAAQQQQAAAVASGSGRANTIEAAGNAYSRRQMGASSSAAARDSSGQQQQQLQQQQQDDPKGALTRAIRAAAEANEVGAQTVQQLARQEEQLDRMQDDLDETDDTLSRTQWMLKGMKSIGGAVSNFFSSGPTLDKHDRSAPSSSAQIEAAAAVARAQALPSAGGGSASSGGAGLSAAEQAKRRLEKELDEEHGAELDQLSGMLKNMHGTWLFWMMEFK
jgi:hypothetical protein